MPAVLTIRLRQIVAALARRDRHPHKVQRMRRFGTMIASIVLLSVAPFSARAQSCHAASLRPVSGLTYRVGLSSAFANFTTATTRGEYQGLFVNASLSHPWFMVEAALPMYRIAQTGSHAYGSGDVAVSARGHLYRSEDGEFVAGPELAATLPTGKASDDLGMGHVMLMPGAFLAWQAHDITLLAQLAYGRALGGSGHGHHAMGPAPIVNPMNKSELTHAFGVSYAVRPVLRVTARWLGAVTVADHAGVARQIIAPGLQWISGAFDAAIEVQVPLAGDPFKTRTLISLGAQW